MSRMLWTIRQWFSRVLYISSAYHIWYTRVDLNRPASPRVSFTHQSQYSPPPPAAATATALTNKPSYASTLLHVQGVFRKKQAEAKNMTCQKCLQIGKPLLPHASARVWLLGCSFLLSCLLFLACLACSPACLLACLPFVLVCLPACLLARSPAPSCLPACHSECRPDHTRCYYYLKPFYV